ncbi:MAG: DUF4157 domain-containing protein [Bacteroidota bacterium]|nr:DUF4157 domain-containing protein [Bacteroidota bacterium]
MSTSPDKQQIKTPSSVVAKTSAHVFFQPKLTVNEPGDVHEQEADAMADKVMRMTDTSLNQHTFFKPANVPVQRKCQACGEEDKFVHRKENGADEVSNNSNLDNYVSSLGSSGQSLPQTDRKFFEPRFGHDFSNVKIHTDTVAAKSADSINALAYTSGNNIVFNSGRYSPGSDSGMKLMAHELTHVVQQSGGPESHINKSANGMVQRAGWSDAKKMNKSAQNIDKDGNVSATTASTILRIPIEGLKAGNQDDSMTKKKTIKDEVTGNPKEITVAAATSEKAAGKAIALVPDSLDATKPVEILLHLHGFNEGYRQVGNSVRDIGLDKIEQQMIASGHTQMIGILPQETTKSGLGTGGFNSDTYINEVLAKVQAEKGWTAAPSIGRVILSAHSGGGGRVEELLNGAAGNQLPGKMQELTLFEAINGPNELAAVKKWLTDQIQKDITALKAGNAAANTAYLSQSMRFRGYYTPQGSYVKRYQDVDAHLKTEFQKVDAAGLDPKDAAQVKANYQVLVTGATGADHDGIIGNGNKLQDSLTALPPM